MAGPGKEERQASRPAANIQYPVGAELLSDAGVGGQITTRPVESVIDGGKARMGKDRIRHAVTVPSGPTLRRHDFRRVVWKGGRNAEDTAPHTDGRARC